MTYNQIIEEASRQLNLPKDFVNTVYKSFWQFIKYHIEHLPLDEDLSEEQFNSLRTNFNVPSLGKMYCIYDKYKIIKEKYKHIKKLKDVIENNKD